MEATLTSDTSAYDAPPPPPQIAVPVSRGWTGSDLAIGSALIVLLIALFLPWFSGTVKLRSGQTISGTGNGPDAHGYLWVVFVLVVVGLVVLVARDALGQVPGNLPSAQQMLVLTTGLALLLSILGVAFKPPGYTTSGAAIAQLAGHFTASVSWSYGGFVAVVAAVVAFVGAFTAAGRLRSAHRRGRAAWRLPGADG
jgi:hypothetical protein